MTVNKDTKRHLLIIFYRNPILGRVKTRLAATVGEDRALEIYRKLVQKTQDQTYDLAVDKTVYYSEYVEVGDVWEAENYRKDLQGKGDLGQKMWSAMQQGFKDGYASVCLIGSDCWDVTTDLFVTAFQTLDDKDLVLGPAQDGGYYLIGMRAPLGDVFKKKEWSTDRVLSDTLADAVRNGWTYGLLPVLSDVDVAEDLPDSLR